MRLMLLDDNPEFANWDQDETAITDHYELQDPHAVSRELADAARQFATRIEGLEESQWSRPGRRSNGSRFTIESLSLYGLHDPIHHLWDVSHVE